MAKNTDQAAVPAHKTYRRLLWVLLIASALATTFFTVRGMIQLVYWSDPQHRNQPLEPWMPLGFVAKSYGVEREALATALDLSPGSNRRLSLKDLAEMRGQAFDDLAREVEAAVVDVQSK